MALRTLTMRADNGVSDEVFRLASWSLRSVSFKFKNVALSIGGCPVLEGLDANVCMVLALCSLPADLRSAVPQAAQCEERRKALFANCPMLKEESVRGRTMRGESSVQILFLGGGRHQQAPVSRLQFVINDPIAFHILPSSSSS